jgi:tRNA-2-methylthio-N6-dimethylallyladenosine synthase
MLLGQNVNSYNGENVTFPELLEMAASLKPEVRRIRFMTNHPKDVSPALISVIKKYENICKHIHLPVQSGSDAILGAMNRKYTRGGYLSLIHTLRREIPGIAITTDIIVGFPGETDADFEDTLNLVKEARFNGAFTFLYSKREGTKAAGMDCPVPENTAKERFDRLIEVINPITLEKSKLNEGKTLRVLAEKCDDGMCSGRAENNMPVHFPGNGNDYTGQIVPVRIVEGRTFYLKGCVDE